MPRVWDDGPAQDGRLRPVGSWLRPREARGSGGEGRGGVGGGIAHGRGGRGDGWSTSANIIHEMYRHATPFLYSQKYIYTLYPLFPIVSCILSAVFVSIHPATETWSKSIYPSHPHEFNDLLRSHPLRFSCSFQAASRQGTRGSR